MLKPNKNLMLLEDKKLYVCLASHPIADGHVVVVWRDKIPDLGEMSKIDYDHLMRLVDRVRNAMLKALNVEKVYLVYMDEIRHVHWHLIPRYNKSGFNVLTHRPKRITNSPLVPKIKEILQKN